MHLVLNEDEQMVRTSCADFLAEQAGPDLLRQLRDSDDPTGYSGELWDKMIELGWAGVLIDESFGGLGFSHAGMGQISEYAGSTLASSPLFSTAIVGASVVALAGSKNHKESLLPAIASGEMRLALAIDESSRHAPQRVAMTATPSESGYTLNGQKTFVVDGHVADRLIVAARTSGQSGESQGITLFLVPCDAEGIEITRSIMVDSRNAAEIVCSDVHVDQAAILGSMDEGMTILAAVLDIGNAHLSSELLGIAVACFDRTLAYLKERTQFGVKIASFQALQHRAAKLWIEIELCKSIVLKALRALDASSPDAPLLVSMAKVKTCKIAELATNEAVQMHGGIGMTDEYDIGFFMKRARVVQALLGDQRYHLNRCAQLSGY